MKIKLLYLFIIVAIGMAGVHDYVMKHHEEKVNETPVTVTKEPVKEPERTVDPLAFLIERIHRPIRGEVIRPKTTAELRAWFSESDIKGHVQRVFVEKFPDDFPENGDKELFSKVIVALILRANEQTLKERAAFALLRQKYKEDQPWDENETNFFNELVQKYDAQARKTVSAQIADLDAKIDVIPPMAAVLQAAEATNWGREHLDSPYEQMAWLDSKTYARLPFGSLLEATDSYAREMNGMPPLTEWRYARSHLKSGGHTDIGFRILRWLNDYKMEDLAYSNKLHARLDELGYEIPDRLKFTRSHIPPLQKGSLTVNGQDFDVELALTPEQKQRGLMFRQSVPDKTGMVFYGEEPKTLAVWMKNTFVPLDILFFDTNHNVVKIIENMPILDETIRYSEVPALGSVEFVAGTVKQYNIRVGDHLTLPQPE